MNVLVNQGLSNKITGQRYYDSTNYDNSRIEKFNEQKFVEVRLRAGYDFFINSRIISGFAMFNYTGDYKATWLLFGVQFYLFKQPKYRKED